MICCIFFLLDLELGCGWQVFLWFHGPNLPVVVRGSGLGFSFLLQFCPFVHTWLFCEKTAMESVCYYLQKIYSVYLEKTSDWSTAERWNALFSSLTSLIFPRRWHIVRNHTKNGGLHDNCKAQESNWYSQLYSTVHHTYRLHQYPPLPPPPLPLPPPLPPVLLLPVTLLTEDVELEADGANPSSSAPPSPSLNNLHSSPTPTLRAGSIEYCKLYRFFLWIGGTNWPDTRHRKTRGER